MIKFIEFTEKHRCFNVSDRIPLLPGVCLLVGDQGCGKSTVIQGLMAIGGINRSYVPYGLKKKVKVKLSQNPDFCFSADFERDNPRIKSHFSDDIQTDLACRFSSHGQVVGACLDFLEGKKNTLYLLDEPDMALSIRSIAKLVRSLKEAATRGCQIIAAVHNPFLIQSFDEVVDISKRKIVKSNDFIDEMWDV